MRRPFAVQRRAGHAMNWNIGSILIPVRASLILLAQRAGAMLVASGGEGAGRQTSLPAGVKGVWDLHSVASIFWRRCRLWTTPRDLARSATRSAGRSSSFHHGIRFRPYAAMSYVVSYSLRRGCQELDTRPPAFTSARANGEPLPFYLSILMVGNHVPTPAGRAWNW
jgi:hypothetical protein